MSVGIDFCISCIYIVFGILTYTTGLFKNKKLIPLEYYSNF